MKKISIDELYEFFCDTANSCKSDVVQQSDEDLTYKLFEEFDVGVTSFFHDSSLARLFQNDLIDKSAVELSQQIRMKWIALQQQSWTIDEIKHSVEWLSFFALGDELSENLHGLKKRQEPNC